MYTYMNSNFVEDDGSNAGFGSILHSGNNLIALTIPVTRIVKIYDNLGVFKFDISEAGTINFGHKVVITSSNILVFDNLFQDVNSATVGKIFVYDLLGAAVSSKEGDTTYVLSDLDSNGTKVVVGYVDASANKVSVYNSDLTTLDTDINATVDAFGQFFGETVRATTNYFFVSVRNYNVNGTDEAGIVNIYDNAGAYVYSLESDSPVSYGHFGNEIVADKESVMIRENYTGVLNKISMYYETGYKYSSVSSFYAQLKIGEKMHLSNNRYYMSFNDDSNNPYIVENNKDFGYIETFTQINPLRYDTSSTFFGLPTFAIFDNNSIVISNENYGINGGFTTADERYKDEFYIVRKIFGEKVSFDLSRSVFGLAILFNIIRATDAIQNDIFNVLRETDSITVNIVNISRKIDINITITSFSISRIVDQFLTKEKLDILRDKETEYTVKIIGRT